MAMDSVSFTEDKVANRNQELILSFGQQSAVQKPGTFVPDSWCEVTGVSEGLGLYPDNDSFSILGVSKGPYPDGAFANSLEEKQEQPSWISEKLAPCVPLWSRRHLL